MRSLLDILTSAMSLIVNPWWTGVPTKLLRKVTLVEAGKDRLPVHTLTFEIPNSDGLTGRAIPLEKVRIDMGDVVKMVIPNYKPKSYSMSALRPTENEFDVTFKVYPNGRASGFLDRLEIGDYINTFGLRKGRPRNPGKFFGGVAYGVGITEILPVAEAELEKGDAEKVVVLWASRTLADTFWHEKVEELGRRFGSKFEIVLLFSRENVCNADVSKETTTNYTTKEVMHGRIDASVLQTVFEPRIKEANVDPSEVRFLTIGTKPMMSMTQDLFTSIGFSPQRNELLPISM